MVKIHKLDIEIHPRTHISKDDDCYYLLEKESEGYSASKANNLIYNFKKTMDKKGKSEWKYKVQAINKITRMLNKLKFSNYYIVPAPTSIPRNENGWDDRIDQVVDNIKGYNITVCKILDTKRVVSPAHLGGSRKIDDIKNVTECGKLPRDEKIVILVDDVLTTGAHFKAWKELILENNPHIKKVVGLFFALHIWKDNNVEAISDWGI